MVWAYLLFAFAAGAVLPFYVFASIVSATRLGAATLIGLVVAGQALASLLVDHFGWVGFEEQPITPLRVVGVALLAGGVALVRLS